MVLAWLELLDPVSWRVFLDCFIYNWFARDFAVCITRSKRSLKNHEKPSDRRHLRVIPTFVRIQRKTTASENCRSRDDQSKIDQTKTGSSNNQWESKEKGLFNLRSQPSHLFKGNDENHHTTVHHNSKSVKNHKTVMQHENITKPWLRVLEKSKPFKKDHPIPPKLLFPTPRPCLRIPGNEQQQICPTMKITEAAMRGKRH